MTHRKPQLIKRWTQMLSLGILGHLMLSVPGLAEVFLYRTSMDQATWSHSSSRLECRISQDISTFGSAIFRQKAGHSMVFLLNANGRTAKVANGHLRSMPPLWRPGQNSRNFGSVKMRKGQTPIILKEKLARSLLSELETGMSPTFYYDAWNADKNEFVVVLSAIGFRPAQKAYRDCLAQLLPYGFADIQSTVLFFKSDSDVLTKKAIVTLAKISTYLKIDPAEIQVNIEGHADMKGKRRHNHLLSERRANTAKIFFVNAGIDEQRIVVKAFGFRRPVRHNKTAVGRAKNRRVTIELVKNPATNPS